MYVGKLPVAVQWHGSTANRRVFVLRMGTAAVLEFSHRGALSSYRIAVGRPQVAINIPVGLHIAFRSKVAGATGWVHVMTSSGSQGELLWHVFSGADPHNGVHGASGSVALPGDRIVGSSLGPCLQRFALQKDAGRIETWLSATDVLHSSRRNWFTVRLAEGALVARVRGPSAGPAAWDEALRKRLADSERALLDVGNECKRLSSENQRLGDQGDRLREQLRKRLADSNRALLDVRKERKRLRTENQRLRDQRERLREQVEQVNRGEGSTCASVPSTEQSLALVHDYISQAESIGFAPVVGLRFASSLLSNSARPKNRWRWAGTDMAFFSNILTRVGLSSYRFLSSELGCPSVATLQRATSIDARDVLFSSSHGMRVIGAYFDAHPQHPRRVLIQHDGIHIKQGVIWTKFEAFVGLVEQRGSLAHFLSVEAILRELEFAYSAEVFIISVVHSGLKHVVRIAPCASTMSALDYTTVLNEVLESLDCNNIRPSALCFDAATPVVKGLKSLSAVGEKSCFNAVRAVDSAHAIGAVREPNGAADNIVQIFADEQSNLNEIALAVFGTTAVPSELLRSVAAAHKHFPVFFRDPYSKEAILLCGDAAHLLKRERNKIYSTKGGHRHIEVQDEEGLVHLKWEHVNALRQEDKNAQARGLPAQEPLLTDTFVNLSSWAKMSVPGALAVYSGRIVAALRLRAANVSSHTVQRELLALALHLEYGRARFDVARSRALNILRTVPLATALTGYPSQTMQVLVQIENYYERQSQHGRTNRKSGVWRELVSTSVSMRAFVCRETRLRPPDAYVLLTRLSTDPLESLFSFVRQTNGGSSNPSMEQLVQGIRLKCSRGASSNVLRALKGNLDPERAHDVLNDIFLAGTVLGRFEAPTNSSSQRFILEIQRTEREIATAVASIRSTADAISTPVCDPRRRQLIARICGAVLALEPRALTKQLNAADGSAIGSALTTSNTERATKDTLCDSIAKVNNWTLNRTASARRNVVYDDIRAIERQDGLIYPTPVILQAFVFLVTLRYYAVEYVSKESNVAHLFPKLLARLYEGNCEVDQHTPANCNVLYNLVRRFTNSSLKSVQKTLNTRFESSSALMSTRPQDSTVPLRSRLAVNAEQARQAPKRK